MNYNPAKGFWEGSGAFGTCGKTITLELECRTDNLWELRVSFADACAASQTFVEGAELIVVCSPFDVSTGFVAGEACCSNVGKHFSIDITA